MLTTETATRTLDGTPEAFDTLYREAAGDPSRVPWEHGRPNPALVTWLNRVAPSLVRCGARVAVVGCGLGHDAIELQGRGYDVTAFDCSITAIDWAQRLHRPASKIFHVADLHELPARWRHRFDLVVEINTIQAQPIERRDPSVRAIADLLSPRGYLLIICRATDTPATAADGPPWPLTQDELITLTHTAGLAATGNIDVFDDDELPPVRRMRALFQRG